MISFSRAGKVGTNMKFVLLALALGLLIASKILWVFTGWYEWVPLALAVILLAIIGAMKNDSKSG